MGEVTPITPPRLVTGREVADYLSIDEATVMRMARQGRLPCVKVGMGRMVRFRMSDIVEYVEKQVANSEKPREMKYKPRKKDDDEKAS